MDGVYYTNTYRDDDERCPESINNPIHRVENIFGKIECLYNQRYRMATHGNESVHKIVNVCMYTLICGTYICKHKCPKKLIWMYVSMLYGCMYVNRAKTVLHLRTKFQPPNGDINNDLGNSVG